MPTWWTLSTGAGLSIARSPSDPEQPFGVAGKQGRLLVARKAGDDFGIGVDDIRIGTVHSVNRPVGAEHHARHAEGFDAAQDVRPDRVHRPLGVTHAEPRDLHSDIR